jgi:predicted nucleic-acid-binding Zn-ribbon protein
MNLIGLNKTMRNKSEFTLAEKNGKCPKCGADSWRDSKDSNGNLIRTCTNCGYTEIIQKKLKTMKQKELAFAPSADTEVRIMREKLQKRRDDVERKVDKLLGDLNDIKKNIRSYDEVAFKRAEDHVKKLSGVI